MLVSIALVCINLGVVTGALNARDGFYSSNHDKVANSCRGASQLPPSPETFTSIQNTLSLFSIAYDTRQLSMLCEVFHPTATTNFTGESVQTGLPAIMDFLQSTLIPGGSQHTSNTLHVNQTSSHTATVVSYLQAIFFGYGDTKGQVYQNYGFYEDQMVKQETGKWLVQSRVIHNFVSFRIDKA